MRSVALLAVASLLSACAEGAPCEAPPEVPALLRVEGGRFVAESGPFVPRGINSYPLLDHAGYDRFADIDQILAEAVRLGRPVVRTGAHMIGGTNPARLRDADGTLREEGLERLDRVFELAEAHGVQLLVILANHWPNYGGAPAVLRAVAPGEDLPADAFYSDPRAIEHQQRYVRALMQRTNTRTGRTYGRDPTVFAWELVNEGRCSDGDHCDEDTLSTWARTMARTIREAGADRPIAWGGQGFLGDFGEDLAAIAAVDEIDILTVHLYPDHLGAQTLAPGEGVDRIPAAVRFGVQWIERAAVVARLFDKPLLVEEAGWRTQSASRDVERAMVLGAWARAAREANAGMFPWMIAERGRPDYDGYLIRPEREPATEAVLRCE